MRRTGAHWGWLLMAGVLLGACGGDPVEDDAQFPENKDIWVALGGDEGAPIAIAKVVDDVLADVLADPRKAPYFATVGTPQGRSVGRLKACLNLQFKALMGGPFQYPGDVVADGVEQFCYDLDFVHAGLGIPGCVFDQFIVDLAAVLQANGVPQAYITRLAPKLMGFKTDIISVNPVYLGPNTPQNCR